MNFSSSWNWVSLSHLCVCFFLTGLIWVIQLVQYPQFQLFPEEKFKDLHQFHSKRITWIVLPTMLWEIATAIALVVLSPTSFWVINLLMIFAIWGVTALVSVPLHVRLESDPSSLEMQRLVSTNWARTALWSFRCGMLFCFFLNNIVVGPS